MSDKSSNHGISALILAGGLGKRLRSVVSDRPKILASVLGRPYITYIFDQLITAGFNKVIICTGYMASMVSSTLGDSYRSLNLIYSVENIPLGTGGALKNALSLLETDTVIVMNGDSYTKIDLSRYIEWHDKNCHDTSILLNYVDNVSRYGSVGINSDNNRILEFNEKTDNPAAGWINAGVYIFKKNIIKLIPSDISFSLEKELFPKILRKGVYGFCNTGDFIDIGTPESFENAKQFFKEI